MANRSDWLPPNRTGQLIMAKDWKGVMAAKLNEWNISAAALAGFEAAVQEADSALTTAQTEAARTAVTNALCKAAFEALVQGMRDTKRRYFLEPPLTDADLVSLGLKPHDGSHTASGNPAAQVMIETFLVGRHELGIRIIYVTGNANDPANKGFRIYYRVVAPGETPPASPEDLTKSYFTKRKKDVIEFGFNDSGSTVFFAVQIENEGKKGPWGPMTSALIP